MSLAGLHTVNVFAPVDVWCGAPVVTELMGNLHGAAAADVEGVDDGGWVAARHHLHLCARCLMVEVCALQGIVSITAMCI